MALPKLLTSISHLQPLDFSFFLGMPVLQSLGSYLFSARIAYSLLSQLLHGTLYFPIEPEVICTE